MNIQTPVNEVRNLRFDQFSSMESLAKATEQARKRNYQDFLIVDVDSHHYESESYSEVFKYIESPVLRRQAIELSLCPAEFDADVAAIDKASVLEAFKEAIEVSLECLGRHTAEEADHRPGALRPRGERSGRRSTEPCDNVAAPHSITSSARSSTAVGKSMPKLLAVLALTTSSNLVGRSIGSSAGLAPLRTLPTMPPA